MSKPIRIAILSDGSQARREFGSVGRSGSRMGDLVAKSAKAAAGGIAIVAAAGAAWMKQSVDSLARIERINTQTATVVQSTGGLANVTAKHVENLAGSLENLTATEAESTQEGANLLLTFTNIRNGVGAGNKIFDQATSTLVDMSRAMGSEPKKAAVQLGKALNDPIKGVTALSKVGVSFTEDQKEQIKVLVESGKTMDAQKMILRELQTEFGGSGKAFAKTAEGQRALLGHAWGTLGEDLATGLMPIMKKATDLGMDFVAYLQDNSDEIKNFASSAVDAGKDVGEDLLPPLEALFGMAKTGAEFIAGLPGPVKEFGLQAGLAALVMPRLLGAVSSMGAMATSAGATLSTTSARVQQFRAELSYAETRSGALRGALRGLGDASRGVAGVGGLLLLTASAKTTNDSLKTLETIGGGALLGFAAGGPIGLAIGATVGGLKALWDQSNSARDALDKLKIEHRGLDDSKTKVDGLVGTYNDLTGAITGATRAKIVQQLQENGDLKFYESIGVKRRTLVDAQLGDAQASKLILEALTAAEEKSLAGFDKTVKSKQDALDKIRPKKGATSGSIDQGQDIQSAETELELAKEKRDIEAENWTTRRENWKTDVKASEQSREQWVKNKFAVTEFGKELTKTFPNKEKRRKVVTDIKATGQPLAMRQITALTKKYNLTPPQVRSVVNVSGDQKARANIDKLIAKAKEFQKQKAESKVVTDTKSAEKSIKGVKGAAQAYSKTKITGPNFTTPTVNAIAPAKTAALGGGVGIGANVTAGMVVGVFSGTGAVVAAVSSVVSRMLAAGRATAKIASPSKETIKDGAWIAMGFAFGLRRTAPKVVTAVEKLVGDVLKASAGGANDITDVIARRLDKQQAADLARFKKNHKGQKGAIAKFEKDQKAERARTLKATRAQAKILAKANAQVAAVKDGNGFSVISATSSLGKAMVDAGVKNLEEAKAVLASAKQAFTDYANTVADSVRSSASLAKLGEGTGFGSVAQMIEKRKALLGQAQDWDKTIAALTTAGLNTRDLDELIAMGPEAGMGTAKAILEGGDGAVTELNGIATQLNTTAVAMGTSTAKTMKQAGIDSAQGLVNGLTAKSSKLDAAAKRLAKVLVRAFKKEMDSHSPSRKMIKEGVNTVDGVVVGMEPKRAELASKRLAQAVLKGYGSPDLPAITAAPPSFAGGPGGAGTTVNITVNVPATANPPEVGRQIQIALDAYYRTGGRKGA